MFNALIKGLKSGVHRIVHDHAPTEWWTGITDLYQKALNCEDNGVGCGRVRDRSPEHTHQPNLADLVTLVSIAMQERNERAPRCTGALAFLSCVATLTRFTTSARFGWSVRSGLQSLLLPLAKP